MKKSLLDKVQAFLRNELFLIVDGSHKKRPAPFIINKVEGKTIELTISKNKNDRLVSLSLFETFSVYKEIKNQEKYTVISLTLFPYILYNLSKNNIIDPHFHSHIIMLKFAKQYAKIVERECKLSSVMADLVGWGAFSSGINIYITVHSEYSYIGNLLEEFGIDFEKCSGELFGYYIKFPDYLVRNILQSEDLGKITNQVTKLYAKKFFEGTLENSK